MSEFSNSKSTGSLIADKLESSSIDRSSLLAACSTIELKHLEQFSKFQTGLVDKYKTLTGAVTKNVDKSDASLTQALKPYRLEAAAFLGVGRHIAELEEGLLDLPRSDAGAFLDFLVELSIILEKEKEHRQHCLGLFQLSTEIFDLTKLVDKVESKEHLAEITLEAKETVKRKIQDISTNIKGHLNEIKDPYALEPYDLILIDRVVRGIQSLEGSKTKKALDTFKLLTDNNPEKRIKELASKKVGEVKKTRHQTKQLCRHSRNFLLYRANSNAFMSDPNIESYGGKEALRDLEDKLLAEAAEGFQSHVEGFSELAVVAMELTRRLRLTNTRAQKTSTNIANFLSNRREELSRLNPRSASIGSDLTSAAMTVSEHLDDLALKISTTHKHLNKQQRAIFFASGGYGGKFTAEGE